MKVLWNVVSRHKAAKFFSLRSILSEPCTEGKISVKTFRSSFHTTSEYQNIDQYSPSTKSASPTRWLVCGAILGSSALSQARSQEKYKDENDEQSACFDDTYEPILTQNPNPAEPVKPQVNNLPKIINLEQVSFDRLESSIGVGHGLISAAGNAKEA